MSTLQATLDGIRAAFSKKVPEGPASIMHRATQDLTDRGQAERAIAVGDAMPAFEGVSAGGRTVTSAMLLGPGPLILTFFRGHW